MKNLKFFLILLSASVLINAWAGPQEIDLGIIGGVPVRLMLPIEVNGKTYYVLNTKNTNKVEDASHAELNQIFNQGRSTNDSQRAIEISNGTLILLNNNEIQELRETLRYKVPPIWGDGNFNIASATAAPSSNTHYNLSMKARQNFTDGAGLYGGVALVYITSKDSVKVSDNQYKYVDQSNAYWNSYTAELNKAGGGILPYSCNRLLQSNLWMVGLSQQTASGLKTQLLVPSNSEMRQQPQIANSIDSTPVVVKYLTYKETGDTLSFSYRTPSNGSIINVTYKYDGSGNIRYLTQLSYTGNSPVMEALVNHVNDSKRKGLPGSKEVRCIY